MNRDLLPSHFYAPFFDNNSLLIQDAVVAKTITRVDPDGQGSRESMEFAPGARWFFRRPHRSPLRFADYNDGIVVELRRGRLIPSAPFSGAPKSEGCCFQSEWLLYRREPNGVRAEPGEQRTRSCRTQELA